MAYTGVHYKLNTGSFIHFAALIAKRRPFKIEYLLESNLKTSTLTILELIIFPFCGSCAIFFAF